jgi:two-component system OmpR family sensor kinase
VSPPWGREMRELRRREREAHRERVKRFGRMRANHDRHHHHRFWNEQRFPMLRIVHSRIQRLVFSWFAVVVIVGVLGAKWVSSMGAGRVWVGVGGVMLIGIASGAIAWRLTAPLLIVIDAARRIGDGDLKTRIDARRHGGETRVLAEAVNDMAARIERQMADQRELLAAVSHELRTPLGHMRILIETERERGGDRPALSELDAEIVRLDDLVGRLLASSRLDFGHLERRDVEVGPLVADVATQAGIGADKIAADEDTRAAIDPTLIRRALSNLIDNARVHGGGAVAVRVERRGEDVALEVDDAGPGVPDARRADAGKPFVPSSGGGLGLGLALVHRIAAAHGGRAWIVDRPGGGARVGFAVPVVAPVDGGAGGPPGVPPAGGGDSHPGAAPV